MSSFRTVASLIVAGAVMVAPTAADATHKAGHDPGSKSKRCRSDKTVKRGYVINGTVVSVTADDTATTDVNEWAVTLTVDSANRHARNSGELVDNDSGTAGTQITIAAGSDTFTVNTVDYEAGETPAAGDGVKVNGKIPWTKAKCAAAGTSTEDRYGTPDIRKVTFTDAD